MYKGANTRALFALTVTHFFLSSNPYHPGPSFFSQFHTKKFCDFFVLIVVSYISVFARRDKKPIWASVGSLGPRVMRFSIPGGVSIPTRSNHHFFFAPQCLSDFERLSPKIDVYVSF